MTQLIRKLPNDSNKTRLHRMLRSCICIKKDRRNSENSSSSSCRSSEIERNAAAISNASDDRDNQSFLRYISSSCFRVIRSPRRGLSMTKVERGKPGFNDCFECEVYNYDSKINEFRKECFH